MPEILGYNLGGAGDIPCDIFEGDDVLGNLFERIFRDSYLNPRSPSGDDTAVSPERSISDGEEILDFFVEAAQKIRQAQEDKIRQAKEASQLAG